MFNQSQTTERDTRIDTPAMSDEPIDHAVTGGRDENLHFEGRHSSEYHTVVLANTDEQQVQRTSQTRPHTQQKTLL